MRLDWYGWILNWSSYSTCSYENANRAWEETADCNEVRCCKHSSSAFINKRVLEPQYCVIDVTNIAT